MINYSNRDLRFVLFRRAGSVLFSRYVLVPASVSTILCALVLLEPEVTRRSTTSSTTAQIYATIIGFALVFRTQMAFGRYFEGVTYVQAMFSKWRDAFVACVVFIETSINKHADNATKERSAKAREIANVVEELRLSKARLLHWFSVLCAVAVQSIQHGRDEEVCVADDFSVCNVERMPANRVGCRSIDVEDAPSLSATMAYNTNAGQKEAEAARWKFKQNVQVLGQLTPQEMEQISCANEAVNLVMMWILLELSDLSISQRLLTEAPIVTRVFQELSNGMLAFFRAMQIEAVPFPFPFAQVINYVLYGFFLFCPFIVIDILDPHGREEELVRDWRIWPALVLNFIACMGYAALNEISIELEDPFGDDENDYPMAVQQWAIIWSIEDSYYSTSAPRDFGRDGDAEEEECAEANAFSSPMRAAAAASSCDAPESVAAGGAVDDSALYSRQRPRSRLGAVASANPVIGYKFRELRKAVEVFAEELLQEGRERQKDLAGSHRQLADLVSSLERNLQSCSQLKPCSAEGADGKAAGGQHDDAAAVALRTIPGESDDG